MAYRNVSASLTLDTSGYRRALSEAAADTRRLIDQLQGIARVAGMDGVTADVHQLDRALGEVPDTARSAGTSAASAFDGFEAELEQLDDQAKAVAREQRQIADAAVEASRRAGGAYRTIGTEAAQAAASARSSLTGLSGVHVGITTSAERAATAEGAIGVAATRSATTARGALSGMAGAHDVVEKEAIQARLAELGIGTAAVSAAELAQRSALEMARSLNVITAAAERAAAAETMIGTSAERAALLAARANTVSGGGGGGRAPGGPSVAGGAAEVGALAGMANTWRTISSVAGGLAAFQGFTMLTRGIREAVVGASDLNESLNKTKFTFGEATPVVVNLANEMRTSFGQSRTAILDAASNFGLIGKAAGLAQPEAAGLSSRLARLAVDAQSFFNVPLPDVLMAFRSGLVGEAEPMRRFGVLLDEASVKSHAYAVGIARVGAELTQAQKVQSRFDLILNAPALKAAEGDMERTADQFANRMRIIGGRLKEWATDVGAAAIPEILKLVDALEEAGRRAGPGVAAAFEKIGGAISAAFDRLRPFFANMVEIGGDLWHILLQITDAIGPFVAALGGIAAVSVISALNGLSDVLSSITGFLAENEGLVKALAIAYGVSLVPRLLQAATGMLAFSRATAGATAASGGGAFARVAGSLLSIAPAATNAVRGFDGVGGAAARAASTSAAGWGNTHRALGLVNTASATATIGMTETGRGGFRAGQQVATGMQRAADSIGRVRVGALGIGLALAEGVMAVRRGWERQAEGASNWAEKQFGSAPRANVKQMVASINEIETQYNRLLERTTKGRDNIGQKIIQAPFHAFGKEVMSPGLKAEADQRDELLRKRNKEVEALRRYESVLNNVSRRTGMTRDETEKFAASQYDLGTSTKENSDKIVASWESTQQAAAKAGVSTEDFAAAAARAGLSLAEGGEDAQKQISAAITEIDNLGNAAGVSGAQVLSMFNQDTEAAKAFLTAVVDVGEKVKGAFLADVDVTTHVNADPKAIADAQKQMADLQSQGKPIPMELQLETQGPLEQLKKFYAQAVEQGKAFGDNARKALALGFDPDLIQRLMLQGPEKAGPLLAALVSQSGAALVGLVNTQEAELRRQSEVVQEIATKQMIDQAIVQSLTTKAVQDESGKRTATLSDAVKVQRAIVLLGEGATFDAVAAQTGLKTAQINAVVDAWGFKLFAAIDSTMGKFQVGSSVGTGPGSQRRAMGGFDSRGDVANNHKPEFGRSGTVPRVWLEPEIGGETYLSHKDDYRRPANKRYLRQTAELFGMVAMDKREFRARLDRDTVRLADGAVLSRHEWVGGSQRRGPTVEGPSSNAPPRPTIDRLRERVTERFVDGGMRDSRSERSRSERRREVRDRLTERVHSADRFERYDRGVVLAPSSQWPQEPRSVRSVGDSPSRRPGLSRSATVLDRLRERVERFAFGGMRDVRRSERERPGAAHHVSDRRATTSSAERLLERRFIGGREPMVPQVPARAFALADHPALRQSLPHPRRESRAGHRLGRSEVGAQPRGLVVEHLKSSREVTAAHQLLRFALGGLRRESFQSSTDRQRVSEHGVGRPGGAVALESLLNPVQATGHVVAPAAHRTGADVVAPQHQDVRSLWTPREPDLTHLGHVPTVRRFAKGGIAESLPQVPVKELAPYNISAQGAGKRGLDTTTIMRQTAVQKLTQRERDVNKLKLVIASQKGAPAGAGGGGVGGGHIDSGWSNITRYLSSRGVYYVTTSTTGGNHVAGSYHYRGKAADLVGTGRSTMSQIFDTLTEVGSSLAELFYDPKGWYIKNGARVKGAIGGHSDHVHAATFRMGGVVEEATGKSLPRQRPFEKERIRRGRDVIEHGPMGTPRRDPVRSKVVTALRDVLVPKGKAMASGGVSQAASLSKREQGSKAWDAISLHTPEFDLPGAQRRARMPAGQRMEESSVVARPYRRQPHVGVGFPALLKSFAVEPHTEQPTRRPKADRRVGFAAGAVAERVGVHALHAPTDVRHVASGGLTEVRAAGAAQPYVRFARGGITSPTPLREGVAGRIVQRGVDVRVERRRAEHDPQSRALRERRPEVGAFAPPTHPARGVPELRRDLRDVARERVVRFAQGLVLPTQGLVDSRGDVPASAGEVVVANHVFPATGATGSGGLLRGSPPPGYRVSRHRGLDDAEGRRTAGLGHVSGFGVSPQRERPARPIRQGRDVRDHPHLRLTPFQRDLKHVSHFEVGGVFDRRDRPGGHGSTLRREALVARGAQPDFRLALGGVAPPASVVGVSPGHGEHFRDRFSVRSTSGPGMTPVERTRDTRTTTAEHHTHSRGLPQPRRMEAPGHARRAALGVHLPAPTATRHTSETVTMDGRRLPLGRPAEDARRHPVKADRSHSTHAMRWGGLVGGITRSVAEFFGFARGGTDTRRLDTRRDTLLDRSRLETVSSQVRDHRTRDTRRDTSRTMQVAPFDLHRAAADSSSATVSARPGLAVRPRAGEGKAGDRPLRIGDLAMARLPSFAKGGRVPGAPGEPRVILAHGGEQVQPVQPIHLGAPGGGGVHVEVHAPVEIHGPLAAGVTPDDVERAVDNTVDAAMKKAADRFLAGVHRS